MPTEINLVSINNANVSSSAYSVTGTSTDYMYINCDNMSKLFVVARNSDTNACAVTFADASTGGGSYSAMSVGDLSTSIAAGVYRSFGPFEASRFKSTDGYLIITSTGSTCSSNVVWNAFRLP